MQAPVPDRRRSGLPSWRVAQLPCYGNFARNSGQLFRYERRGFLSVRKSCFWLRALHARKRAAALAVSAVKLSMPGIGRAAKAITGLRCGNRVGLILSSPPGISAGSHSRKGTGLRKKIRGGPIARFYCPAGAAAGLAIAPEGVALAAPPILASPSEP